MLKRQLALLSSLLIIAVSLPMTVAAATVNSLLGASFEASFCKDGKMFISREDFVILDNTPYMKEEILMLPFSKLEKLYGKKLSSEGYFTEEKNGELFVEYTIIKETHYSFKLFSNGVLVIYSGNKLKDNIANVLLQVQGVYVVPEGKRVTKNFLTQAKTPADIKEMTKACASLYGDVFPVNVFFHGGEFRFKESLTFEAGYFSEDRKGLGLYPYGDGEVVFSGSTVLDTAKMKCANDPYILARLRSEARGEVGVIDLSPYGPIDFGTDLSRPTKVYIDDEEMILSRWPNKGFANINSVIDAQTFTFSENDGKRWGNAKDMIAYGYFYVDYAFACLPIANIDAVNKIIKLDTTSTMLTASRAGARWYAANLIEEIDIPGEYYVDKSDMKLYIFPPHNLKNSKLEIISTTCDIINLTNINNVTIKNLGFEKTKGRAIYAQDVKNFTLEGCNFKYIQHEQCIAVEKRTKINQNVNIKGNYAYGNAGQFADVILGEMQTLTPSYSEISNNHIVSCRRENAKSLTDGTQITLGYNSSERIASVGVLVQNNLIQDCGGTAAICFSGPENKVLYNEIYNQSPTLNDGGAIYAGMSTIYYGCEVAYNYVHDLNKEFSYVGYYNDDAYSGAKWHHNIARNMNHGFLLGLGMDMEVTYNLMIDNTKRNSAGSRMTWNPSVFGPNGKMINAIASMANDNPNFYEKYPVLKGAVDRDPPMAPWNSIIFGNVGVSTGGLTFGYNAEMTEYGADTIIRNGKAIDISDLNDTEAGNPHFDYSDNYFVDAQNGNYNVKPDSELAEAVPELLEIDITKTGLTEEHASRIQAPGEFLARYPRNKSVGLKTKNFTFSWDTAPGATYYRLVVSKNSDLSDPVIDEKILENGSNNCYITDELELNTVYYWKVYAQGLSRQKPFSIESKGGPYVFKTASKNDIDKSGLTDAITALGGLIDSTGSEGYRFSEEYSQKANELVKKAKEIKETAVLQDLIDAMEEEIYTFILLSPYYVEISFTNIEGLYSNETQWSKSNESFEVTHNGDEVIFDSKDSGGNFIMPYVYPNSSVLCFKAKFEEFDGGYQAFYFKDSEKGDGYLFVVKEKIFEFQTKNKLLIELPNDLVKAGEYHNYEIGAVNLPNGVLRFVRVDGNVLYANLDRSKNAVYSGDRFYVRTNPNSKISIMPYDEKDIPQPSVLIDEIYKSFNAPYSKAQLEALLIGASDCLELSDLLYTMVDKARLCELIYDKLSDIQIKDRDFSKYHAAVMENTVIAAYNQGLIDYLFKDKCQNLYSDITRFDLIDKNGVNLYKFMNDRLTKSNLQSINRMTLNKDVKSLDELRREYAKSIFTISINACSATFAIDTAYMYEIITKENADYMNVDLSEYFALSNEQKNKVHERIGKAGTSMERTFEQLIADINTAIAEIK